MDIATKRHMLFFWGQIGIIVLLVCSLLLFSHGITYNDDIEGIVGGVMIYITILLGQILYKKYK